jgi:rhomboid protease GluP
VRVTPSRPRADEWVVVLAALDVPCLLREGPDGWTITVSPADAAAARAALDAYDAENEELVVERPEVSEPSRPLSLAGVYVALLLLAVFALSGARAGHSAWFVRGSADARLIVAGEWWRTVTALTLHADAPHVLGNAVAAALLVSVVCQALGVGLGLWLVLLAGVVGNLLTAVAQRGEHVSVGASTAVFGAIGILAALRLVTPERMRLGRRRRWVIAAAVLLLLVLFGTGPDIDVLAHLFGLLAGVGIGLLSAVIVREPPRPTVQWLLVAATAAAVTGAWWWAFR